MNVKVKHLIEKSDIGQPAWDDYHTKIEGIIQRVTLKLMNQTWDGNLDTIHVIFPRHKRRGSPYLGGAHGTIGVAYMIMMACMQDRSIIESNPEIAERLANTFMDLLR